MEQSSSTMSTLPPNTNTSGDKPCLACEPHTRIMTAEENRLAESRRRKVHWKRWGPYLSERQWGRVRDDYSPYGTAWEFFPHDHARSRTYRWGRRRTPGHLRPASANVLCAGLVERPRSDPQRTLVWTHRQ